MAELFEENIRGLISHFKSNKRSGNRKEKTPKKQNRRTTRNNGNVPSTSRTNHSSDDDDDDDDDDNNDKMNGRNGRLNGRTRRAQPQSNGVSSSRDYQSGRSRNTGKNTRLQSSGDEDSESSESSSDDSSDGSENSSGIPLAELGKPITRSTRKKNKKQRKQRAGAVSSSSQKKIRRAAKLQKIESDEHNEETDEDVKQQKQQQQQQNTNNNSDNGSDHTNNEEPRKRGGRGKRIQTTSDDENKQQTGDEARRRRITRRPKRYESDTSFHVERSTRHKTTETEDSDHPRATRESTRKKFQEWAVTSDDNDDEDFEDKPQTSSQRGQSSTRQPSRKKAKRKVLSDSEHSEDKSRTLMASRRSTRVQVSQSQDDSNDSVEQQNRPSTSTNVRHSSRLMNGSSNTSQMSLRTTRSSGYGQGNSSSSSLRNDHNYGEPSHSASTSAAPQTARQTRSTILSRHQRNADELDRSGLEDSTLTSTSTTNRLLRLRSVNLRAAPTPATNFEALNGIRRTTRTRPTHNYFEDENDPEEERPVVQQIQSRISTNRTSRIIPDRPRQPTEDDSDSYSEEDKTPLKLMATSSNKKTHDHYTRKGSSTSAVNRIKRNLYSDDNNSDQVSFLTFYDFLTTF